MKRSKYKVGDVIDGVVTGIQPYGVFVKLDDQTQGLIHISECQHGYVNHLDEMFELNETVKVKVIDIDEYDQKISLSIRALQSLDIPPFPAKLRRIRRRRTPKIGFKTVEEKMSTWIEEGLQAIETDQFNLKSK